MIAFTATLKKFGEMGEKTGWTYLEISAAQAAQLKPGTRKAFRVKGWLDELPIEQVSLVPVGEGNFILAVNEAMRRGIGKRTGASVHVRLTEDTRVYEPAPYIVECLQDEPEAATYFESLPRSHRNYFTKWIESARTEETRARRLACVVNALLKQWDYEQMIRAGKEAQ
jgi:hypothetical protein